MKYADGNRSCSSNPEQAIAVWACLPVKSVSHYAQDDTHDGVHCNKAGTCNDLIIQSKAIVCPLAIVGTIHLQKFTPGAVIQKRLIPPVLKHLSWLHSVLHPF